VAEAQTIYKSLLKYISKKLVYSNRIVNHMIAIRIRVATIYLQICSIRMRLDEYWEMQKIIQYSSTRRVGKHCVFYSVQPDKDK